MVLHHKGLEAKQYPYHFQKLAPYNILIKQPLQIIKTNSLSVTKTNKQSINLDQLNVLFLSNEYAMECQMREEASNLYLCRCSACYLWR